MSLPKGFIERKDLRIYEGPEFFIITGEPQENDEEHNCDYMGCAQEHVLHRIYKADCLSKL